MYNLGKEEEQLNTVWTRINEDVPEYMKKVCEKYGMVCEKISPLETILYNRKCCLIIQIDKLHIVNSLVTDIFTPLLSLLGGGTQMESLGITFGIGEHAATLAYGSFLSAVINFLVTAFAIFCLVKAINTVQDKIAKKPEEEKKEPTTKKCPFCQSEIDIRAIRCPFCTSELEK